MKVFLSITLLAAVAFAEPPTYRQQQQQQQRYYFARQQEETTAASAPYAPRGWKPEGPAFNLPQRSQKQEQQPPQVENAYGAPQQPQEPQQQYGPPQPPQQQYGPPQAQGPSPRQQGLPTLKIHAFARQQQQPQQGYGAPSPQEQYGAPQQQQPQQYRFSARQQQQPQQGYGAPNPQEQYGAPQQQQPQIEQYRIPARQQQQPQQGYGAPSPQEQYGAPQQQQSQTEQYRIPARQQQQPQQGYGAPQPQEQYGAPQQQYGAPDYTTTEVPNATEIDEPITESANSESEVEPIGAANELEGDADLDGQPRQEQQQERGEYYVALPDGRLQRVRYVSRQDLEAMQYFAKIRAENVEPLRGPIYAYSPLQKLEVAPGSLQVAVAPVTAAPGSLTVTATESKPQKLVQQPKVDIKPLAQVQVQHDNPAQVVPLSSSYTTYTANYQVPATEERYILAFP